MLSRVHECRKRGEGERREREKSKIKFPMGEKYIIKQRL